MDSMVHYTSLRNWREIQETGFLLPNTLEYIFPDDIKKSPPRYFIVGIPYHCHEGWVSSGLMRELIIHTLGAEVMLQIPIVNKDDTFIREHVHLSPQRLEEMGMNFFYNQWDPSLKEAYRRYMESTIALFDYEGSYRVPEIWLPQTIPVDLIEKVIECPDFELLENSRENKEEFLQTK